MVTGHRVAAGTDHHSCAPGKVTRAGWEPWDFLERPNSFGYACILKLTSLTAKPPLSPALWHRGHLLRVRLHQEGIQAGGCGAGEGGRRGLIASCLFLVLGSLTPALHPSRGSPFPRPRLKPGDSFSTPAEPAPSSGNLSDPQDPLDEAPSSGSLGRSPAEPCPTLRDASSPRPTLKLLCFHNFKPF